MRKASQNYGFIVENDKFIGIALGYDYCAEHEWGIKDLKRSCGMQEANKKNMRIKNRIINKCPLLIFKETVKKKKNFAILYTGRSWDTSENAENYIPHDLKNFEDDLIWREKYNIEHPNNDNKDNIITAWDEGSFGIAVMGEKEIKFLKELHEELKKCNIAIAVANFRAINPFAGSSLCILITDRIPKETIDVLYYADKEFYDREDYEEKIGMKKIINKYGNKNGYNGDKYFMACSPKWIDYDNVENREKLKKELNTKYNIHYWINYSDNDNNHGYYSVEEIKKWLTGKKKLTEIRKG